MVVVSLYWVFVLLFVSTTTAAPVDLTDEEVDPILVANKDLVMEHPRQVIEGDILVNKFTIQLMGLSDDRGQVQNQLPPDENRKKKASMSEVLKRKFSWPNCVIPFAFASYVGKRAKTAAHIAMDHWMEHTCVKFIPRTNETDYILFVERYGCWSELGRIGGEQMVSLGDNSDSNVRCKRPGVVIHELGHTLGFFHEQSRPDRDKYVVILTENIQEGKEENFLKYSHLYIDSLGVEYDLGSIMHYGKFWFSKNGKPTILPKEAGRRIGQRKGLSELDIKQANLFCKCAEKLIKLRPSLSTESEPPLSIQSTSNGLCLHTQSDSNLLTLDSCQHNSSAQMWQWNGDNQLYNPTTLKCITTNAEGLLELRSCEEDDLTQQWLCADHFIKQPSTGNCITASDDSDHLMAERCALMNSKQRWNKYTGSTESEMEEALLHMLGDNTNTNKSTVETICTIPGYHTVEECYSQRILPGWSYCSRKGYFVTGLYHIDNEFHQRITDFHCCFTSHVFTGEPETLSTIEEEICTTVTWWSSLNRTAAWFRCPTGQYFKGYLKVSKDGLDAVQKVKCCKTDKAPQTYRQCYTDPSNNSDGLHKCNRAGYHITAVYKANCSLLHCIEKLLCCI